jgi:hypothetical protein
MDPANRVIAPAHIEDTRRHDILVILDSDTLFLREPCEFILPPHIDVAVRPVDVKGTSSGGPKAGAGWVEPAAGKLWGSSQAALSLAIWSTSRRVRELPPTYNYPLHLHDQIDPVFAPVHFPTPPACALPLAVCGGQHSC